MAFWDGFMVGSVFGQKSGYSLVRPRALNDPCGGVHRGTRCRGKAPGHRPTPPSTRRQSRQTLGCVLAGCQAHTPVDRSTESTDARLRFGFVDFVDVSRGLAALVGNSLNRKEKGLKNALSDRVGYVDRRGLTRYATDGGAPRLTRFVERSTPPASRRCRAFSRRSTERKRPS
jgi:hypothetical protein